MGDFIQISHQGESVDLMDHLVPGKYTVVDFYADWCLPCREIEPFLKDLTRANEVLAVRKVNIFDWDAPVVAQYDVTFLPYLRMYDPQGVLIADGAEPVLEELSKRF